MGADFIYITCPRFTVTDQRLVALRALVGQLPDDAMAEVSEAEGFDLDDVAGSLLVAINQLPEVDCRRDVSTIDHGDVTHWITGGMSWGDAPTDAFGIFGVLSHCQPLMDLMETWARADRWVPKDPDDRPKTRIGGDSGNSTA